MYHNNHQISFSTIDQYKNNLTNKDFERLRSSYSSSSFDRSLSFKSILLSIIFNNNNINSNNYGINYNSGFGWLEVLSILLGWSYTFSWGISFYPQVFLNFKRKSVRGVSIDFLVLNVLGFICYSISTGTLLFSKTVREEYSNQFIKGYDHGSDRIIKIDNNLTSNNISDFGGDDKVFEIFKERRPSVRINDLVFSLHALVLSLITWYQSLIYKRDPNQKVSSLTKKFILLVSFFILIQSILTINYEFGKFPKLFLNSISRIEPISIISNLIKNNKEGEDEGSFLEDYSLMSNDDYNYLNLIKSISSVKVLISIIKYLPQLKLNFKRKSTIGWSIGNIILDLLGGILSLTQMVLDASISNDMSSLTSNPGKLGISLVSIGFDVLFMIQHYILYNRNNQSRKKDEDEMNVESYNVLEEGGGEEEEEDHNLTNNTNTNNEEDEDESLMRVNDVEVQDLDDDDEESRFVNPKNNTNNNK